MTDPDITVDPFAAVVGQDRAVAELKASAGHPVHAYMFLGPHGSGRWDAAKAFAALLLSADLDSAAADRAVRLAIRGEHPDLVRIDPAGSQYRDEEVREIIVESSRSPVEGSRKVIVADRFHTANATAIGRLLKTLEEPPPSTVIILLSESVPDEQTTIASRCVIVRFSPVPASQMIDWLVGRGADPEIADMVSLASGGDLRRAADLVGDPQVSERHAAWRSVPDRLDGTGAAVAVVVDELRGLIDAAQGPLEERHAAEMEGLAQREERLGTRGSGRRDLEAAHRREIRRLRDDELRFGLATLAGLYRDLMAARPDAASVDAVGAIRRANEALGRNPNEALLLQALLVQLSPLSE